MKKRIIYILCGMGLLVTVLAHIAGYKIFGSPTLYENQPLDKARKIAKINETGELILIDGSSYHIYGIKTILSDPLNQVKYFQWQLPTFEVEIVDPNKPVSKVWCKIRLIYWCGNTWFPRFLPGRLPKFSKMDLGEILVREGAAIPTVEVLKEDLPYGKQLILAMERTVLDLKVQINKECVEQLGKFLIEEYPEFFCTGAWLLAHIGDVEICDILKKHIAENLKRLEADGVYLGKTSKSIFESVCILIKTSPADAGEIVRGILQNYKGKFPYLKVDLALKLLTIDDWTGLDKLMDEIVDTALDISYRQSIVGHIENPLVRTWGRGVNLYFASKREDYYAGLSQWYRDNKGKLVWNDERQEMTFRTDDDPRR